ncbi:hypothetical protein Ctha_0679 [Chloroherpeton thalassium ATCC 35110]|uniref:Chemoreceptor zinc-binding domain-containing protein n=1 Tax=Chloroherpeton thalassium (strain ATCC 35110 / GB-78) TaxID=517418 RepID=B3QVU1_CHLT3|nr:CZB domain-containing protein [Chloroherpeton thalassium]ACF13148.1 hypothetical protein Ctha_0679 [Chloroherpeton thalassium ATCC 35110]
MDLVKAMNDHSQYLRKVVNTLNGKADFKGVAYEDCSFGQWLHNEAENVEDPTFKEKLPELKTLHKEFHELGRNALKHHEENSAYDAQQELTKLYQKSNQLLNILNKLM